MINITEQQIDEAKLLAEVKTDQAGAVVLFLGTTRVFTDVDGTQKQTARLEYECYREMALKELEQLEATAREKWSIVCLSIMHRIGEVPLGETSVAIAVSSRHRSESFEAGRWLIDTLKGRVPIWKKENWADGSTDWVHPEPIESKPNETGRTDFQEGRQTG